MKPPSKNISASLRGQSPGGKSPEPIRVSRIKGVMQGPLPGESDTEMPPGQIDGRSARHYAAGVGGTFGNSKT